MSDRHILDAFEQIVGPQEWDRPRTYDPRADLDEESLRRLHRPSLSSSQSYRRAADMPREPWRDEVGVATGDYREEWSA